MENKIIIESDSDRNRALALIKNIPLDPVHDVIICPHKEKRTLSQNALYFKWIGIFADEIGDSKENLHHEMKKRHIPGIVEEEVQENPESQYVELVERIEILRDMYREGQDERAAKLYKGIVADLSTTRLEKHLMSKYMNYVEQDATEMNIRLPHPEDLK